MPTTCETFLYITRELKQWSRNKEFKICTWMTKAAKTNTHITNIEDKAEAL